MGLQDLVLTNRIWVEVMYATSRPSQQNLPLAIFHVLCFHGDDSKALGGGRAPQWKEPWSLNHRLEEPPGKLSDWEYSCWIVTGDYVSLCEATKTLMFVRAVGQS